jgi:DUF1680 family protein
LYYYIGKNLPEPTITVNGKRFNPSFDKGYALLNRKWKKGDVIQVNLPMEVRRVGATEKVPEDKNNVSLEYGPVVYCVEGIDNNNNLSDLNLPDQVPLSVNHKSNFLGGVNVITGNVPQKGGGERTITAIPYYVWSNRGAGTMKVWLPRGNH